VFTSRERTVVLKIPVLRRNNHLLTHRELQLRLQPQPQLLLTQPQVKLPACHHFLQIFGILQLNMSAELQVYNSTHLRAVLTSVRKITEPVNKGHFSNQNVTLSMRRRKPNHGRRSERRLMRQSAAANARRSKAFDVN
jgi:hypothetical protein